MALELSCPNCAERFRTTDRASSRQALERLSQEEASFFLGDGETFEDMLYHHLADQGELCCPECGESVFLNEENLGVLAMSILHQW